MVAKGPWVPPVPSLVATLWWHLLYQAISVEHSAAIGHVIFRKQRIVLNTLYYCKHPVLLWTPCIPGHLVDMLACALKICGLVLFLSICLGCNVYLGLRLRPTIESFFVSFLISDFKGVFYVTYKHVFVNFVWVLACCWCDSLFEKCEEAFRAYFNQSEFATCQNSGLVDNVMILVQWWCIPGPGLSPGPGHPLLLCFLRRRCCSRVTQLPTSVQ